MAKKPEERLIVRVTLTFDACDLLSLCNAANDFARAAKIAMFLGDRAMAIKGALADEAVNAVLPQVMEAVREAVGGDENRARQFVRNLEENIKAKASEALP